VSDAANDDVQTTLEGKYICHMICMIRISILHVYVGTYSKTCDTYHMYGCTFRYVYIGISIVMGATYI
jgi:hypothetical protein